MKVQHFEARAKTEKQKKNQTLNPRHLPLPLFSPTSRESEEFDLWGGRFLVETKLCPGFYQGRKISSRTSCFQGGRIVQLEQAVPRSKTRS